MILCDNEIDRDYEAFTTSALYALSELFVGKTGIFDHNPKGENQTARIYDAWVEEIDDRFTLYGQKYACLKAKAYMVRNDRNSDLILEIDGGIKKEVSVGCSVKETYCSVCGLDVHDEGCKHKKGETYGDNICFTVLSNPTDAYEFSFVAVPAQKNAGVTKAFKNKEDTYKAMDINKLIKSFDEKQEISLSKAQMTALSKHIHELEKLAELGKSYLSNLQTEVVRLAFLCDSELDTDIVCSVTEKMNVEELKEFKRVYEAKLDNDNFNNVQLFTKKAEAKENKIDQFKL